jgi:branched-chain amino acid aminotransferase
MVILPIERTTTPAAKPVGAVGFGRFFTDHLYLAEHDASSGWHGDRIVPRHAVPMDLAAGVLHYGLSIFEGLKAHRGVDGKVRIFRPDAHARRFAQSAARLCLPEIDQARFLESMRAIVREDADWYPDTPGGALYIRPLVLATEPFLGVRASAEHTYVVMLSPVASYFSGKDQGGLKLWLEREHTRAAKGGLGSAKTGANYAASLLAARRAQAQGYDQVLWMDANEHRWIEEAGTMNVFVRIGDRVITPPLGGSILAGVTRDSCLTLLRSWGITVEERPLSIDELAAAESRGELEEIWGTGTAAVMTPVDRLGWENGHIDTKSREISSRLRVALEDIFSGRAPDPRGWMIGVDPSEAAASVKPPSRGGVTAASI